MAGSLKEVQLRDAKARLSELVEEVVRGRPKVITRHGRPAVVVVSVKEWERINRKVPSFAELLLASPLEADDLPERRPARAIRRQDLS